MHIALIYARAANGVIGKDGTMPWHLPEDLAHFKQLTHGSPVIMGRKTWDSLPPRFRPLPGRRNIVISRQADYFAPGAELANSLENGLEIAANADCIFIIGGEQIYRQAMAFANRLEITEVDLEPEGDAWFPEIPTVDWEISAKNPPPSQGGTGFSFISYRRKR